MDRLPFDPAKMAQAPPSPAHPALIPGLAPIKLTPAGKRQSKRGTAPKPTTAASPAATSATSAATARAADTLTVSALAARINQTLEGGFPATVRVVGEISNFSVRTHWYFAIKDASAVVNCVMFAGRAKAAGFVPEQGQQVVVTARVELYEPSGRLTLNIERIEPVGAGALELQLRKLIAELRDAGWLDPARKRPLPTFPRRVAIVTSRKGAALQDVLDTMRKRCPAVEVCLVDVLVQGPQAAPAVASAIHWLAQHHQRLAIDAILVTRGGGSIEDLWAFNDRAVARAIHDCPIPIVAAIGHETDTTLAELVADLRCATPTQAAMALTPDRAALLQQNTQVARRLALVARRTLAASKDVSARNARDLTTALRQHLGLRARALAHRSARLERGRPANVYERRRSQLRQNAARLQGVLAGHLHAALAHHTALQNALVAAARAAVKERARAADDARRQLELIGPAAVLRRGYSITLGPTGQVVRTPTDVTPGQSITTRLAEGEVQSVVGQSLLVPLPTGRKRKPKPDSPPGLSLFGNP